MEADIRIGGIGGFLCEMLRVVRDEKSPAGIPAGLMV